MVFVLDHHKKPLMPCTEKRARKLLEHGRAVIHKMAPFTIRLKDRTVALPKNLDGGRPSGPRQNLAGDWSQAGQRRRLARRQPTLE